MHGYILSILASQPTIVLSWGLKKVEFLTDENGLIFSVNGFKHKGYVKVTYNEGTDLFDITLLTSKYNEITKTESVYADMLVETIDSMVERTDNYSSRIWDWFNLN